MSKARKFSDHPEMQSALKRQSQLQARSANEISRLRKKLEAIDTRRKIVLGALVLHHMRKNRKDPLTHHCIALLDEYAKDCDRPLYAEFGISSFQTIKTLKDRFHKSAAPV